MKKITVLYVLTSCRKTGPTSQILNLIKNLDSKLFDANLVTIYPEKDSDSILDEYKLFVSSHKYISLSKKDIILGRVSSLTNYIEKLNPDVIHSLGVFPDYTLSKYDNHIFTCRNFIFEDYPSRYGFFLGNILALMHLHAIKRTKYVYCCSESLHDIYLNKLQLDIPFIRNGVDLSHFSTASSIHEKKELRRKYNLPLDKKIFVYGAAFNDRKNHSFLLEAVTSNPYIPENKKPIFLLLGDGPNYNDLKSKYDAYPYIIMPGLKNDISEYLRASDYYVSTSKSEGLPNGVLEALASGLPVLLSGIPQHIELFSPCSNIGETYLPECKISFWEHLSALLESDYKQLQNSAIYSAKHHFSAVTMSHNYQIVYKKIFDNL